VLAEPASRFTPDASPPKVPNLSASRDPNRAWPCHVEELADRRWSQADSLDTALPVGLQRPVVARYEAARRPDEKLQHRDGASGCGRGHRAFAFTSTSELETLSWVLSFGGEAELLEPEALRNEMSERLAIMLQALRA